MLIFLSFLVQFSFQLYTVSLNSLKSTIFIEKFVYLFYTKGKTPLFSRLLILRMLVSSILRTEREDLLESLYNEYIDWTLDMNIWLT